jgi:hypothetical protein
MFCRVLLLLDHIDNFYTVIRCHHFHNTNTNVVDCCDHFKAIGYIHYMNKIHVIIVLCVVLHLLCWMSAILHFNYKHCGRNFYLLCTYW